MKWPLEDAARAVQFLRSKAGDWNIDKNRVGATGARPAPARRSGSPSTTTWRSRTSTDPVARESTRLTCAAVNGAQTSLDPEQFREWMPNMRYGGHAFGFRKPDQKGRDTSSRSSTTTATRSSPGSRNTPPTSTPGRATRPSSSTTRPRTSPPASARSRRDPTHSAVIGLRLLEKLRKSGVEAHLSYPGHKDPDYANCTDS